MSSKSVNRISTKDDADFLIKSLGVINGETSGSYNALFYDHITYLLKLRMQSKNTVDELQLNLLSYRALGQYNIENAEITEKTVANEIDWELVDTARNIFKERIKERQQQNGISSESYLPIIKCTTDLFEDYFIYDQMYPNSPLNPWEPAYQILKNGFGLFLTDNEDQLKQYNKGILKKANENGDISKLGLVARLSKKKGAFNGTMIDNRHKKQGLIYEYLRRNASGRESVKTQAEIKTFLEGQGKNLDLNTIRNQVLLPLKRAGLIGSNNQGYYFLVNSRDYFDTYKSHKEKIEGIQRTLRMFEEGYSRKFDKDLTKDFEKWEQRMYSDGSDLDFNEPQPEDNIE